MSIARPNYDNLPTKQAERRRERYLRDKAKKQAEAQFLKPGEEPEPDISPMGERRGRPPLTAGRKRKATCQPEHKKRAAVTSDGKCHECAQSELLRIGDINLTFEEALEKVAKAGGEEEHRKQLQTLLRAFTEQYARIHILGASIAAAKGDTRPAEWALQAIKLAGAPVVAAPAKDGGGGGGGVKVLINIPMGLMPQAQAIDAEPIQISSGGDTPALPDVSNE